MRNVDWYFDFISPFAYLQWQRLRREAPGLILHPKPLLFAGLLNHWDNKGPVEIAPKRSWTYAHCLWIAHHHKIPMQLPARHPFNPLPLLRLSIVAGNSIEVIDRLFRFVWVEGHLPDDASDWNALLTELGIAPASLDNPEIKQALRANGEAAIECGVFGVPSAVVGNQMFWGVDATDMLLAFLKGDSFFTSESYQRAYHLPSGQQRK